MLKTVSHKEWLTLLLGSSAMLLYALIAWAVVSYRWYVFAFHATYLATIFILPLGLFWLRKQYFVLPEEQMTSAGRWLLGLNLVTLGGLSLYFPPYSEQYVWQAFVIFGFLILMYGLFARQGDYLERLSNKPWFETTLLLLIALLPVLIMLNTVYGQFIQTGTLFLTELYRIKLYGVVSIFLVGGGVGLAILVQLFFFEKRVPSKYAKYYIWLICFSPLLLIDSVNTFDIEHYNAYLAPAIAVLHGKLPLVDVFCHYGLSYLVFTVLFLFFPNNYAVAGLCVSILNVTYLIVCLLILKRVIRNPSYFLVMSITFVLGAYYLLAHSPNIVPSAMALRYLPSTLLLYVILSSLYSEKKLKWVALLFCLNVFWSLEALVFASVILAAYYWLVCKEWRLFFVKTGMLLVYMLVLYAFLFIFYKIFLKNTPDYMMYLDHIYSYLNPRTKIGSRFLVENVSGGFRFFFWIPAITMSVMGLFYLLYHRFIRPFQDKTVMALLLINVTSVVFLIYFILQPSVFVFLISGFLSLVFIGGSLCVIKDKTESKHVSLGASSVLVTMCFMFAVIAALSVKAPPMVSGSSGNVISSFLYDGRLGSKNFFYNLKHFCSKKEVVPGKKSLAITENTCSRYGFHDEMSAAINKWYGDRDEVLLFHRDMIEALMEHHKAHRLFVNPPNDSAIEALTRRIVDSIKTKVHVGDVLVVDKDLDVSGIEHDVLKRLSQTFRFVRVEETPHLLVFELKEKGQASDLVFPLKPVSSHTSISSAESANVEPLFDSDKDTVWFVPKNFMYFMENYSLSLDLGQVFWIDDLKLWRRIDFRVPEFYSEDNLGFIKKFNIEFSEDGNRWSMVASEPNFEVGVHKYYRPKIKNKMARYIKVNVLSHEYYVPSISEIEVFGRPVSSGG